MSLTETDRLFFTGLARAAFANPFSEDRWRLDAELTELPADDPEIVPRLLETLRTRLDAADPKSLSGPDAELVRYGALFETFHRFAEQFDDYIRRQGATSEVLPFPSADAVAGHLVARGLSERDVPRAMELFYQLRRAFYFLNDSLVGESPIMRKLKERLWDQLFTRNTLRFYRHLEGRMQDFSVLLVGSTGTGKSAAAAALGRAGFIPWSSRGFAASFVDLFLPLNLSELPGTLLESALFGHTKGAFTGAVVKRDGAFARSSPHGVIFLDEIGEVETPTQIKLLRVLQERLFTPLGASEARRFEGRVIGATHQPLDELRRDGRMRDDFYYRLCSDVVTLPSLASRIDSDPAELARLVDVVVGRTLGESSTEASQEICAAIRRDLPERYAWPGNVRELEQCVRRVLLTGHCQADPLATPQGRDFWARAQSLELPMDELVQGYCVAAYERHGSYEAAARQLGVDRRTVRKHVGDS